MIKLLKPPVTTKEEMQFEYDPEKLIDEVEKRPGIWDFDSVEYRTRNVRHELWVEIVKELSHGAGQFSKSELRELEMGLQKKWKSIRDCYQKYLANPNRNKRPYIYYKKLQFLRKGQETPQQDDTSDSESEKKLKTIKIKKKLSKIRPARTDDEDYEEVNDADDNDSFPATDYVNNDSPAPAKVAKKSNSSASQSGFAFANVDAPSRVDDNDPERLFLLSLLPYLKDIPQEVRLNVKMELMQVLQQASFNATRDHKLMCI